MKRFGFPVIVVFAACLFLSGCQAMFSIVKPALENEGEIYIYLEPFSQEAERLKFKLEGVSVLRDDGAEFPLVVLMPELKLQDVKRQRLFASCRLSPGRYTGFVFKVKNASLKTEDGEAALNIPDVPARGDFLFNVERKKAFVISMEFKYKESIKSGFSFSPVFSIFIPEKPINSLIGYVTNSGSDIITIFDKKKIEVTGVIAMGRGPKGITLDKTIDRAYVALYGEDAVEVVDVSGNNIISRINLNPGDNPQELALTPDRKTLITANTSSNTVSIIDTGLLSEVARITVGDNPNSVLIDQTGTLAYVFNTFSNNISVINILTREVVNTLSTGPEPLRGVFSRNGEMLYVIHRGFPYIVVLKPSSTPPFLSILRQESIGMGMSFIKVDSATNLLYISKKYDSQVAIYDPFSLRPVDYILSEGAAGYTTIDGEENNLYLVIPEKRKLAVFNLVNRRIVSEIDTGEDPYWVTVMGER